MAEQRFLVVRLGSLGDIVHTFPAVAGLRHSFPDAEIVWLTHPRFEELVASSRIATEIWPIDSRDLSSVREIVGKLRKHQWTAGIDYQGLWKSALLPFFGRAPKRIGFSSDTIREFGVPTLYTDSVKCQTTHIADQNGELSLRAGASCPVSPFVLQVYQADADGVRADLARAGLDRYIVLSPGGGWRAKCWPPDRFGVLCQRIRKEIGIPCVVNYGPGEAALAADVQSASGAAKPFSYDGQTSTLRALLRGAECIVGGDTGPLHLAIALGTPAVALFGPTDPVRNGPYPPGEIVLRSPKAVTTYGRSNQIDPSLLDLSVDTVFAAVKQRLGITA
ncbi:MAG TPA: glycosyltransferase family 9 protein [Candidatus Eremiobacteraceae bacterium]|nr:glycosyltransferase family 9 protein [Candidatus Eremiobacteraceae bacterium]